jgi:hypothetical protein
VRFESITEEEEDSVAAIQASPSSWVFSHIRFPSIHFVFICLDGVFISLFFHFHILVIFRKFEQ